MSTHIPTIDIASIPDYFGYLNYRAYCSHRERLADWSAAAVQAMFIRLGIATVEEAARWEREYQAEVRSDV